MQYETKGFVFESNLDDDTLAFRLNRLAESGNSFAGSLLRAYRGRWGLSPKQRAWAHRLALESAGELRTPQQAQEVSGLESIVGLFEATLGRLRWPKITVRRDDQTVRFQRVGRGPNEGSINVSNGLRRDDPENRWYGRISPDGRWTPTRVTPPEVERIVRDFAADPVAVASSHGHRTGNCCFCSRDLTDQRSVEVGYGPVCAGHYGLPWGS